MKALVVTGLVALSLLIGVLTGLLLASVWDVPPKCQTVRDVNGCQFLWCAARGSPAGALAPIGRCYVDAGGERAP